MPASANRSRNPRHPCLPRWAIAACAVLGAVRLAAATATAAPPAVAPGSGAESPGDTATVNFARDIAPILAAKCLACHQPSKAKGNYRLHTPAALAVAGRSGESPIVAGQPGKSPLHQLLLATDPDDRMPKDDDPLPPAQIALIRRWIEQGARTDGVRPDQPIGELTVASGTAPIGYPRPVPILALAFSPDGTELAIGGYHEVLLRNASDGALARRISGLARQIQSIAFSPDGRRVAIAAGTPGRAGEVVLVESDSAKPVLRAGTAGDLMTSVAFSPDGRRLALGGADNTLRVVETDTGRVLIRSEHHADWILDVRFDRLGNQLLTSSRDKTVRLLTATNGGLEETYAGHAGAVFAAMFSPDGRRVVSGGRDRELHLWQANDGRKLGSSGPLPDEILRLASAGPRVLAGLANGEIREFRLQEKKLQEVRTWGRHGDGLSALAVHAATPVGDATNSGAAAKPGTGAAQASEAAAEDRVATAGHDGRVRIWDLETGKPLADFAAFPEPVPGKP